MTNYSRLTCCAFGTLAVLVSHCAFTGCRDGSSSPNDPSTPKGEEAVIEAVRHFCVKEGYYDRSVRVVIEKKMSEEWWVWVGPESVEARVRIDPHTLRVLEFMPGE